MKQSVSYSPWKDGTELNWGYQTLGTCQWEHGDTRYPKHSDRERERVGTRTHRVREEAREYIDNYLATHPCIACGESDPQVLELHYPDGKGWIISHIIGGGNALMTLQAEVAKCVVLCASCHRKISKDELGWFMGRK